MAKRIIQKKILYLETLLTESDDSETNQKITETIEKLQTENYDKLNYFKLKKLNETI